MADGILGTLIKTIPASVLPTNAKTLVETLQGDKSIITEKHFTQDELKVIRDQVINDYNQRLSFHKSNLDRYDMYDRMAKEEPDPELRQFYETNRDYKYKPQIDAFKANPKSGNITYGHYGKEYTDHVQYTNESTNRFSDLGLGRTLSPEGRVMTTLGQYNYKIDPDQNNINVTDKYDFNAGDPNRGIGDSVYSKIRGYAGEQIPEGRGRDVNINIPYSIKQ